MDVTEAQLTIALQEAFRCYLAFLSYDQKLRESKLPRQGKGVETTADISTQQYYQSRINAIEASLQYIGKIARRVERWVYEPPEEYYDEEINAETEEESFEVLPNGQDSPYLDFFSGCLVYPTTPFSAGPSNSNDEAAAKELDGQGHSQPAEWLRPHVTNPDGMGNEVDEDVAEIRGRGPNANPSSRACLGIHPNTPISVKGKSPELYYSVPSSKAPSVGQKTPTSSVSANEGDNESSEEESEEDESSEESEEEEEDHDEEEEEDEDEDEDEEGEDEGEDSDLSQDESDESESEDDTNSIHPDITAAFQPQDLREVHDADHAERIHTAEAKEAEGVDKKLTQARNLAEQLAREDEVRLQRQKKYAEELRQQERESQERIQKDREAALEALKEQEEWELAAIARETAAMRAEERKRREEAEAKRVAEQERRLRIEREKRWAEEIKQRNAEEKRKREAEEAERRQRDAEDSQRRQREAEEAQKRQRDREKRKRTTIIIDCLACMEPGEREDMAVLPCRHAYCGDCIKDAFKSAYKSRTQFKCCGIPVSTKTAPVARYLSPSFTHRYSNLLLELSTRHPKYCSSPSCSRFLPPTLYNAPSITCPKCKTRTCTLCTKREHAGVCKQDKDGIRVEKLAKRKGWQKCPGCSQVVERTEGCLHITCRCGAEWCYACLRDWSECGSACGREPRMGDDYDRGEGRADGPPRVAPLVAGAMFIGLAMLRERGMRR